MLKSHNKVEWSKVVRIWMDCCAVVKITLPRSILVSNMKFLRIFQTGVAIGGISSIEQRFNRKTSFVFVIFGLCVTLQCIYIFQTANSFNEYTDCVYKTGTTISILVCYASLVFHKAEVTTYIDGIEKFADKSE